MTTETTIPTTDQLATSDMVQQTFTYWFADHEHVRSPFPFYIHDELRVKAVEAFQVWMSKLNAKANEEITEGIAHEQRFPDSRDHEAVDVGLAHMRPGHGMHIREGSREGDQAERRARGSV